MFATYDDADIGSLETEEIEGTLTMESDMLKKAAEEFESNMKRVKKIIKYFQYYFILYIVIFVFNNIIG